MRKAFDRLALAEPLREMLDPAFEAMCQGLRNDQAR
jgi:hypothetical protein